MTAPLGLIAGLGDLPVAIAENAVATGQGVYVLRLKGFEEPRLENYPGSVIGLGEIGKLYASLKTAGCRDVLFAGIVKRPNFKDLKLDMRGAALLPKVLAEAGKGDDALLRLLVAEMEKQGFNVIGSDAAHAALRAPSGHLAGPVVRVLWRPWVILISDKVAWSVKASCSLSRRRKALTPCWSDARPYPKPFAGQ